jgi:5'-3' exonuclease
MEHIKNTPTLPFLQLLCILSPNSKNLLPSQFHDFFNNDSPLKDIYPSDFDIDYEGKYMEYQGIAILPFVDMKRMIKEYEKIEENVRSLNRNKVGKVFMYYYDEKKEEKRAKSKYGEIKNCKVKKIIM